MMDISDPWEVEIALLTNRGVDPEAAWTAIILTWLSKGDPRPLADAIIKGHVIHKMVLHLIADMILDSPPPGFPAMSGYQLKAVPRKGKRGRPWRKPEDTLRDYVAFLAYERRTDKSEKAFEEIAKLLGTSHQTVRRAVTNRRAVDKLRKKL